MKSLMFIAGGAVFAASLATAAPASAGPKVIPSPENPALVQTTVALGDLDLGRPAGAQVAVKRIRRAAKAVCGSDTVFSYPLALQTGWRACSKSSMANAVDRLDHPMVTRAAYGEKAPTAYAAR
jgi:UrcA family protein